MSKIKSISQTSTRRTILLIVVAAMAVFSVGKQERLFAQNIAQPTQNAAPPSETNQARQVEAKDQIYNVRKGEVTKSLFFTGELTAARSVNIMAPNQRSAFQSMITYLAPEGEQIKAGDRLVEFDPSTLLSQRTDIERRVNDAKLKIDKKKLDLEADRCDQENSVAQAEYNLKDAQLYANIPKDLQAVNQYEKYQVNLEKAQVALQKAKEQLANFEASYAGQMKLVQITLDQALLDLKKSDNDLALLSVKAPQDGIVVYGDNWQSNRKIQEGDNVIRGTSVVTLPDLSSMQVVGYVYDTELAYLSKNLPCSFGLDAIPDKRFQGVIQSWDSVATRKGFATTQKVFKAIIKPDTVDLSVMKIGMTAHVEIVLKLASDVMTVSREYVGLDAQSRHFVLKKIDNKKSQRQYVKLGAVGDNIVELVSGANIGDSLLPVQKLGGSEL
jgi:HlyD family secretion protein